MTLALVRWPLIAMQLVCRLSLHFDLIFPLCARHIRSPLAVPSTDNGKGSSSSIRSSHNHHFNNAVTDMRYMCVSVLPVVRPSLFERWILTLPNDLRAGCAHEGERGTDHSAQVLTRKNWKMTLHPVACRGRTRLANGLTLLSASDLQPRKRKIR